MNPNIFQVEMETATANLVNVLEDLWNDWTDPIKLMLTFYLRGIKACINKNITFSGNEENIQLSIK